MAEQCVVVMEPGSEECVELPTNSEDSSLSVVTLERAFPGAHGLKYKNPVTGAFRALKLDESGTKFLPPADGWEGKIFTIVVRLPAQSNLPIYVPIEVDDLICRLENYLFFEETGDIKCCFTVISSHHAISYNHGHHQDWNPIEGYPDVNSNYQALEGIFSSIERDDEGRMRGSSDSKRGYSGGPIFNYRGELLGINVANESSTKFLGFDEKSTLNEVFNEINATFPFLSVIVPAYYLAYKYHKDCKFRP